MGFRLSRKGQVAKVRKPVRITVAIPIVIVSGCGSVAFGIGAQKGCQASVATVHGHRDFPMAFTQGWIQRCHGDLTGDFTGSQAKGKGILPRAQALALFPAKSCGIGLPTRKGQ
tara:strand:+ start:2488 stop:2829 length:342 start_codon:yes stop_codon:yes gene_type:complete